MCQGDQVENALRGIRLGDQAGFLIQLGRVDCCYHICADS